MNKRQYDSFAKKIYKIATKMLLHPDKMAVISGGPLFRIQKDAVIEKTALAKSKYDIYTADTTEAS